jgi:hypothetical protein
MRSPSRRVQKRDSDARHCRNPLIFAKLFDKSSLTIRTIRTKAEDYTRNAHAQALALHIRDQLRTERLRARSKRGRVTAATGSCGAERHDRAELSLGR